MPAGRFHRINVLGGAWGGAVLTFVLGGFLLWYGIHENWRHWLLNHRGQHTMGVLEEVTRTKHSVNFIPSGSSYSFGVSFQDQGGGVHRLHCDVNDQLLETHTVAKSTFSQHPIEVVFL